MSYDKEYYEKNKSVILNQQASYRSRHPERRKEQQKRWKENNPIKNIEVQHNYYKKSYPKIRGAQYKRLYGITIVEYDRLYQIQCGKCAICKRHQTEFKQALSVDHCHEKGTVRGLLCLICNMRLATIENKEWVEKAVQYLNKGN